MNILSDSALKAIKNFNKDMIAKSTKNGDTHRAKILKQHFKNLQKQQKALRKAFIKEHLSHAYSFNERR